jgi:hypothetical protein
MENVQTLNRNLATVGNSLLLVWWGIVMIVHPLTIGMGAVGTGLILLGVNASRLLKGIPTKGSTTALGIIALVWGTLDSVFDPRFEVSFAMLLIVIGLVSLSSLWAHPKTAF